ncbi:MAG: hypothetical protein II943_00440 [Victivallales bacterium]|nr:hypothetical protein [Victivallales bacterium]
MPELSPVYATQYAQNVYMMAQQQGSLLYNHVSRIDMKGEKRTLERAAPTQAQQITTMYGDTPIAHTRFSRRVLTATGWHWGDMLDWQEEQGMAPIIDPTGSITQSGAYAMGRALDSIIINKGLYGSAVEETRVNHASGSTWNSPDLVAAGSESTVAFPDAQKLNINLGGSGSGTAAYTGLNLEKLLSARSLLGKSKIPMKAPGQEVVMVIGQSQLDDLLRITQVQSSDYNTVRALVAGEVDTFLGFKFVIVDEDLLPIYSTTASSTTTNHGRICFAYLKSNVVLAQPQPIQTTISTRADKCNNWQVYSKMKAGATRYEDVGVVHIPCKCTVPAA